jgi:hypothetical protein
MSASKMPPLIALTEARLDQWLDALRGFGEAMADDVREFGKCVCHE